MWCRISSSTPLALAKLQLRGRSFTGWPWHLWHLLLPPQAEHLQPAFISSIFLDERTWTKLRPLSAECSLLLHFLTHTPPPLTSCCLVSLHSLFLYFLILKEASNVLLGINCHLSLRKKPTETITWSDCLKKSKNRTLLPFYATQFYSSYCLILDRRDVTYIVILHMEISQYLLPSFSRVFTLDATCLISLLPTNVTQQWKQD